MDVTFNCKAFALDASGQPTGNSLADISQAVPINATMPASVAPGAAFEIVNASATLTAPADSGGDAPIPLIEVKGITTVIEITGAAAIGTPTLTGGNILDATATVNGALVTITLPGTTAGSIHPGSGTNFIPAGASYTTPEIKIPVTAGAAGSQVAVVARDFSANSVVNASLTAGVRQCAPSGNTTVAATQVLAAGAPAAADDSASTNQGTAVTVNVLANDTPNATLAIDTASLKITTAPTSGTAVRNADGTITYTPNAGFSGTDTFVYELCSVASTDPANPSGCDTATVTITVAAPVAAAAPVATSELPRTGSDTSMLTLAGLALVALGLMLVRQSKTAVRRP